jgi:hypothetical protein
LKNILIFLFSLSCFAQEQAIKTIVFDNDIMEFIEDVNYNCFLNKKLVFTGITSNTAPTEMPLIAFDSVAFSKFIYKTIGFKKEDIPNGEAVFMTKEIMQLDDIFLTNKARNQKILGEQNRVLSNARKKVVLQDQLSAMVLFLNKEKKFLAIDKIEFYVNKVKHKTGYKVLFYKLPYDLETVYIGVQEVFPKELELLYATDTLYLNLKDKRKIEIDLKDADFNFSDNHIFCSIQLIAYYDENNNPITVLTDERTSLMRQLSNDSNFFQKMFMLDKNKTSEQLININAMIRRDFLYMGFSKMHKSIITTLALNLVTREAYEEEPPNAGGPNPVKK